MRRTLLVAVALAGCHRHHEPSEDQLAEIDRIFAAANDPAADAAADHAFQAAAQAAASLAPGDAACAEPFTTGNETRFAERLAYWASVKDDGGPNALQAETVTVVRAPAQLATLTSASRAMRREDEQALRAREAPYDQLDGDALIAKARELVAQPLPSELLIVIRAERDAKPIDDQSFQAGAAIGRAYLYRHADHRIVCTSEVMAESSSSVQVWRPTTAGSNDAPTISADLYLNLITAAQQGLHVVR